MISRFFPVLMHDSRHRAMWKNFIEAISLLTIALMFALYSSSAGRDGRVIAAGVAALAALAMALWVTLRFVPRLARNVDWNWIPFTSHYRVTFGGWVYLGAITIVIFAAINTSNNLLYMVLSGLLGVLLVSGFLSALNFRFLSLDLRIPNTCFAGEPFPFSLQVDNQKRVFPALSLEAFPLENATTQLESFYYPAIKAGTRAVASSRASFLRRGRYRIDKVRVRSRYPFGFFSKGREYEVAAECVCFPPIMSQDELRLTASDIQGENQRFERGQGHDLYTIRDYVYSDGARRVHWKASAKSGSLKTREHAADESRRIVIGFDRYGTAGDGERFERLVSYAASLTFYLIRDGAEVAFVADDWHTSYGASDAILESILTYLADVEMTADVELPFVDASSGRVMLSLRKNGS